MREQNDYLTKFAKLYHLKVLIIGRYLQISETTILIKMVNTVTHCEHVEKSKIRNAPKPFFTLYLRKIATKHNK